MKNSHANLLAVAAVVGAFATMAILDPKTEVKANLFTVRGPVVTILQEPAKASAVAVRQTPRVIVMGDSTGEFFGRAAALVPGYLVDVWAMRRCPLRPDFHRGRFSPGSEETGFLLVDEGSPHVGTNCAWKDYVGPWMNFDGAYVVVFTGPMSLIDFDDGNVLTNANVFLAEMDALASIVTAQGGTIAFVGTPASKATYGMQDAFWVRQDRVDAFNSILRSTADAFLDACFIDYATWSADQPDPRQDGAHMAGAEATRHAEWILSRLPGCAA